MSDDETAFLRAIRANPADPMPRLAFADWLDEHDRPDRAEFVRIQVELEPIRFELDRERVRELLDREEELLLWADETWFGTALRSEPRDGLGGFAGPYFRGGVIEYALISLDMLLSRGEALLAEHPTVRELAIYGVYERGAELAGCELLERLDILEIADRVTEEDADTLLASPHIRGLKVLRVWDDRDDDPEVIWWNLASGWPAGVSIELWDPHNGLDSTWVHSWNETLVQSFAKAGRTLSVVMPRTFRFPLRPEGQQNLYAGRLGDGRPVLIGYGIDARNPLTLAVFDEDGNLVEALQPHDPGPKIASDLNWLAEQFGFRQELIWVREFTTPSGLGVSLWSNSLRESASRLDDSFDLWDWLHHGSFVITWCNTPWASRRTGRITDT